MRTLKQYQRVVVRRVVSRDTGEAIELNAAGTVGRIRTDGSAFVALDERSRQGGVHPFPEDDANRGLHVVAYPEDCDPAEENRAGRRAAVREETEQTKGIDPYVPVEHFGRDHWTTLAYLETCCVDYEGVPQREKMRCDPDRHPMLACFEHAVLYAGNGGTKKYPTRLRNGVDLHDHDDWDCALDLEVAGLLERAGTGANPVFRMTDEGYRVCAAIRRHRAEGGSIACFSIHVDKPTVTERQVTP